MPAIFSEKSQSILRQIACGGVLFFVLLIGVVWYYFTPKYTRAGYEPHQPVAYSHAFHVGELGLSCLYCHTNVDQSPHANVPATETCMNCHLHIKAQSPLLAELRETWEANRPVRWKQIHRLPDYAYFNHAVHIQRGVSCVSCHGKINEMAVVYHAEPLSMGWCLECHRNPAAYLRPRDQVLNLDWQPKFGESQLEVGTRLQEQWNINPPETCQGCHR